MKKVLILGAGMVVRPIVKYLLEKDYSVTLADQMIKKAEKVIDGHPKGHTVVRQEMFPHHCSPPAKPLRRLLCAAIACSS